MHPIFTLFLSYPLWERTGPSFENNPWKSFPNVSLCLVWLNLEKLFWMRFLKHPTLFPYFLIISHLKENLSFILDEIFITLHLISLFHFLIISRLKENLPFIKKNEALSKRMIFANPSHNVNLCQGMLFAHGPFIWKKKNMKTFPPMLVCAKFG